MYVSRFFQSQKTLGRALLNKWSASFSLSPISSLNAKMDCVKWAPVHPSHPTSLTLGSYGIMILNSRIELSPDILVPLWQKASIRITVDGGTDRWFTFLRETKAKAIRYPDIVSGDFDSITKETLSEIRSSCECEVVETPDQDYTDFEKGLRVLCERKATLKSIVIICENTGRVDQSLNNLNTLRLGKELPGNPSLFLLSSGSLTWHLTKGKHSILVPKYLRDQHQWCAILPFEPKENRVTTTGLKWDLNGHTIKFGGLISSSNTYSGPEVVTVDTDSELLWSMGL